ncbi:hypothetical protein CU097_011124 [Rhizopus azygosporus]|uniref:C3H1-type domain-containing protein n=1 Tax=Rhizopus azygosporus TaxID=86630 RepID=A0A367JN70_RHIAZ|nr:hypothetical protein CU097_011124 [Rhizopus azygosporus]
MTPDIWTQLKNEIHNKLVTYEYVDATDFIVGLMRVGKNPEELSNELQSLVGSDYDPNVTQWFYDRKRALENPEIQKPTEPTKTIAQPETPKDAENEKIISKSQQGIDVQPAAEASDKDVAVEQNAPSKSIKLNKDSRIFSKAIGSALNLTPERSSRERFTQERRRERSRSPSPDPKRPRTMLRDDRHKNEESKSNDVFSRLGGSSSTKEVRPSVFDRLGTVNDVPAPKEENTKSQRCKYWPTCKNGEDCPFFHPTTVCPDFPNCPNKPNECMFIHPETHKKPATMIQPQFPAKLPYPCKFFPYCNNPVCPYIHPIPQQAYYMQSHSYGQRVPVPCKNGDDCTRPNCHFLHPKDPNPFAEIICKYDGACTRPNCLYKHTKENPKNKVLISKPDTTNRQFSVPEDQIEERIIVGESADIIKPETQQQERIKPTQPNETNGGMSSSMELDADAVTDA